MDHLFAVVIVGEVCYNGNSGPETGKADEIGREIGHDVDGVHNAICKILRNLQNDIQIPDEQGENL